MQAVKPEYLEIGAASAVMPGETRTGDRHAVGKIPRGVVLSAIDGLGHGEEAAEAAEIAGRIVEKYAGESVIQLLERCHERLRRTRGVVMNIAAFDADAAEITWMGIGNVQGVLLRQDSAAAPHKEHLLCSSGVVGHRFERPLARVLPVNPGDVLIFATDGLDANAMIELKSLSPQEPAERTAGRLLRGYWRRADDGLVVVARFKGNAA